YNGDPKEDINEWIHLFTLHVTTKQLDPVSIRLHLITLLSKEAKTFYQFIDGNNLEIENVLEELRIRFERETRRSNLNEIKNLSRSPAQTYAAFFEKYVVLARKCNIPEDLQLDWMTDRLPQSLNMAIATLKIANIPLTTDTVLDILRSDTVAKTLDLEQTEVSSIKDTPKRIGKKPKWCKHHKYCNHTTKECRYLIKKSRYLSSVEKPTLNGPRRFQLLIRFPNNKEVLALVDTGADLSCINSKTAKKLALKLTSSNYNVLTANGTNENGKFTTDTSLTILGHKIKTKLLALDNLTHDMIIGLDVISILKQYTSWEFIFQTQKHQQPHIVNNITEEYKEVMNKEVNTDKPSKFPIFKIDTGNNKPIQILRYKLGKPLEEKVEIEIEKLLNKGIIRKSNSPWC
ncbi:MAG: retropepsin-like aspartic protease, partial [Aeromonas sp.]